MESSATADSRAMDGHISLIRQDTPHLTLNDYRQWQHSPVNPVSPELDHRRVRRKPSLQNLSARSAFSAAFERTPSSIPPPSIHSFNPHYANQPSTPRPRAYISSPSLSSTITTLQSTPTHTPILRAGSFDDRQRDYESRVIQEPVNTKRKYPSVKHARRFPRRQTSGEEGSWNSGIYKVYAAVFDISDAEKGLSKDQTPQAAPSGKQDRVQRLEDTSAQRGHEVNSTHGSERSHHRREQTVTSSFSLSKFEFPAPPNKDNWAGTSDYLPRSPSATVLYRGASFDLINPHASLLLGTHSIETPAEIDCLLDDYFEEHDEFVVMSSNPDTGEVLQQSLRSVSDSKQTHILYDDADTARRNILRIPAPVATDHGMIENDLPATAVTMPNFAREPASDVNPGFTPLKRSNTNPFRNKMTNFGRSLGLTNGAGNRDLAEEGRARDHAGTFGFSTSTGNNLTQRHRAANEDIPNADDGERFSEMSNPFDLSVSEVKNNAERMNINGVPRGERSVMLASASGPADQRTALTVEDGSNTHAMSEIGGDYESSLINKYDYTRETFVPVRSGAHDHSMSTPSVELGRGANYHIEEHSSGWAMPVSPGTEFRSSPLGYRTVEDVDELRPRPLVSRRNGTVHHSNMPSIHREMRLSTSSDVPTSEQTYGETNQLLQIAPNTNANIAGTNMTDGRQNPVARALDVDVNYGMASLGMKFGDPDMDNDSGFDDDESMHAYLDRKPDTPPRIRTGSVALSPSIVHINRFSVQSRFRTSSDHARTIRGHADEDGWVDEVEDSPGLTEDDDLDENGARSSHSPDSHLGYQLGPMAKSPHIDSTNHLQCLALGSFPNLNNPCSEISPQRERIKGKGRITAAKVSPGEARAPLRFPSSSPAKEIKSIRNPRRRVDFAAKPTGDVKRALAIMKHKASVDKLGAGKFMSEGAHTAREFTDMQEMERIRVYNKEAMDEATARFQYERSKPTSPPDLAKTSTPNKLQKLRSPFSRPNYNPSSSFQKIATLGRQQTDHGSFSSQRGLLAPSDPASNLEFSASEGTFVTIRRKKDRKGSAFDRTREWDPHGVNPTDHALGRIQSPPSAGHAVNGLSNLRSVSCKSGQQATPAIGGQIELREFKLKAPNGRKGLTDKQLSERAPAWTERPTQSSPDSNTPKLLPHKTYQEQMSISLKYQSLSVLLPFGALVYGLGGFDRVIARKTQGRITSMDEKQKSYALKVYFPLQLLAYCIIGIVAGIGIYIRFYDDDKHR